MLDTRCLDEESEDEFAEVYYALDRHEPKDILDLFVTLANLFYDSYVDCRYEESIMVFIDHCN